MHLFEKILSVPTEEIEIEFRGQCLVPWANFLLNPRRLRGSDFLMRWSQGVWSEERLIQAVDETDKYFALPYGPSGTAPTDDVKAFELYFERLEQAGLGRLKRPDLLIFQKTDAAKIKEVIHRMGGVKELPFIPEESNDMEQLLSRSVLAVECENSLWRAAQMPDYGSELKPQRRLGGLPGLKSSAVLPTIIIKEEDRSPLLAWQEKWRIDIHIWHVFYDLAFGISLKTAESLIKKGKILPTEQVFQAPGGATTSKRIYKIYYHYAYPLGTSQQEPTLMADYIIDKNGHILPYVRFKGGQMRITEDAVRVLDETAEKHKIKK